MKNVSSLNRSLSFFITVCQSENISRKKELYFEGIEKEQKGTRKFKVKTGCRT
jgi:hypothetical protein